ncbi:Uncharacterized protein involved in exopolysaccharide biosynthesis [Prevotella sp. khp7]|uniref:hypothetical protein n=1 Tax=Prevotella sp. khp7 TaxID=1761885 RepID=UPI0008C5E7AB|nr:hypothetical protein [Prevotella sp. khp7]SEW22755.1 Uncharacterized protein involved in exopolysaccharide biosynthesis [Prevotella sp. khp7]
MSDKKKISLDDIEDFLVEDDERTSSLDFRDLWNLVVLNLRWFALSVLLCVLLAGAYLYWARPSATVIGKMQLKESRKESGMSASLAALTSSIPFGLDNSIGGATNGEVETEIIKSTILVRDVVNDLGLHTSYRLRKWGRSHLLYQNQPVNVTLDSVHLQWLDRELPLTAHQIKLDIHKTADGYEVEGQLKENKNEFDLPSQTFAKLPATIKTAAGTLTITENTGLTPQQRESYIEGYTLTVTIVPPMIAANGFLANLEIEPATKKSSTILSLSLEDENVLRGIDFINRLVEVYNRRSNEDKNEELMKTDAFVSERLAKIDAELGSTDADWEQFKTKFHITDPQVDAQEAMSMKSGYETKLVEIGAQLQIVDYLSEYVNNPANRYALIPSSVGLDKTSSAGSLTEKYNEVVLERNRLLKSVSEQSPQVQLITKTLDDMYPSVQAAFRQARQAVNLQRQSVEREYNKYIGRVGNAPGMERAMTDIGRQRNIKQGVYLVMLQKREETAMELANVSEKGKLIDETQVDPTSVMPQKKIVLLAAVFLGLLIPLGILFLLSLLRSNIATMADLKKLTTLPTIGEIPQDGYDDAIRNLRTQLLQTLKPEQKVILVASNDAGDGTTFIAKHLADSLTTIGKKAIYMDCDLRKQHTSAHPADILAGEAFATELRNVVSGNDYVVLDSPALGAYSDANQLAAFADVTIYVVKAGRTQKSVVSALNKNCRLPDVHIVLNAIDMTKKKYKLYY